MMMNKETRSSTALSTSEIPETATGAMRTELVPLSKIAPSGMNPRKRFENIDRLADAIRATGGVPVNPIICVADGGTYRIVDGERRFRALGEIYRADPDHAVPVICVADYDDAAELRAMLATDSKEQLTAEERNAGIQLAMKLDVPTIDISRVSGEDVERIDTARTAARAHPEALENPAVTIDALVRMAAVDLTPDEVTKVLGSRSPLVKLDAIEQDHRNAARLAKTMEVLEGAGVPHAVEGTVAGTPEPPEGFTMKRYTTQPGELATMVAELEDPADLYAVVRKDGTSATYVRRTSEPDADGWEAVTERLARLDAAKEEVCDALTRRLCEIYANGITEAPQALRSVVRDQRQDIGDGYGELSLSEALMGDEGYAGTLTDIVIDSDPSLRECVLFLAALHDTGIGFTRWNGGHHAIQLREAVAPAAVVLQAVAKALHLPLSEDADALDREVEEIQRETEGGEDE